MRQPKVAPLLPLLLALAFFLPVALAGRTLLVAGAFLVEFLTDGRPALLTHVTRQPRREPLPVAGVSADRYAAPALRAGVPLVLVHGFTPEGKDDPRAGQAARLLARAGFEVAVPSLPGLMRGRLRPKDVEPVVATIAAASARSARSVVVMGVSVGAGPALLAAADPRVRDRVATVVSLGGYASALELLRFFLTGGYAYDDVRGHVVHDPEVVRAFIAANADLIDEPTRRALSARDPARTAAFLRHPPPDLRGLLDALSPERVASDIRARLLLVHGREDRAVPYTETLRLAAARPLRTRVLLLGIVDHVEGPGSRLGWRQLGDLLALWTAVYGLQMTRD
ncbi:MAG TPA: alpha/beta fold hydrolase [Methylomirabilota bacterium]|nr:alpha/beta fold hydrolase [Methylomirabilota bacterium]